MRALIFGANGQVGRALVDDAPECIEVHALDRQRCDISQIDEIQKVIAELRPNLIINAAAYTAVDRAEGEPELAYQINATAPGWIARAARGIRARFFHISTDFVFDGARSRPYGPGDAVAPLGVYGRSKLEGEIAVRQFSPDAVIVRTAWVYSAYGSNFMKTMLRLMHERGEVAVVSDQFGTPTYARSIAHFLWHLSGIEASGIYHFTDSGVASWYDFAVAIEEEARANGLLDKHVGVRPILTKDYPTPARRPLFSVLEKSTTWNVLGRSAPHWRANLRVALKELKNNG